MDIVLFNYLICFNNFKQDKPLILTEQPNIKNKSL
jgi:hypothetical protein